MLPLLDRNPTLGTPFVTVALILVNVAVFLFLQGAADPTGNDVEQIKFAYEHAAIPCELTSGEPLTVPEMNTGRCGLEGREVFPSKRVFTAVLLSMFLHGGWFHIAGNMLFLWIFGNNIEDRMGHVKYLVFYLAAGVAATVAQVAFDTDSAIPVVGASGAIAGVMGAYLVWFPQARIVTAFIFILILVREIPAWFLLLAWFGLQFLTSPASGVAWMAHVGGFVFGVVVALALGSTVMSDRRPVSYARRF